MTHFICTASYGDYSEEYVSHTLTPSQGANLDAQNVNLQTPLHLAVERHNIQIVRVSQVTSGSGDV